jgi:hypothetical protein
VSQPSSGEGHPMKITTTEGWGRFSFQDLQTWSIVV